MTTCASASLRDTREVAGGSAGGELMGAVVNTDPDLWGAVVADVPFSTLLSVGTALASPLGEPLTPNIDSLAKQGALLKHHYTFKFCSPTRSSFLSGRLPLHVNQQNHPPEMPGGGVDALGVGADALRLVETLEHGERGRWIERSRGTEVGRRGSRRRSGLPTRRKAARAKRRATRTRARRSLPSPSRARWTLALRMRNRSYPTTHAERPT